jgi:hypothetical protein
MFRVRLIASIVMLLSALGVSVARAQIVAGPIVSGPVLTPDGVAWAEYNVDSSPPQRARAYVVRSAVVGGQGAGVHVRQAVASDVSVLPELHASEQLLAVGENVVLNPIGTIGSLVLRSDTRTWGRDGAPMAQFGACGVAQGEALGLIGLWGFEVASCDESTTQVVVFDGRTGQMLDQISAGRLHGMRIAGRFVAWLEGGDYRRFTLVVFDRDARQEVLRVPTAALGPLLYDWDLRADGAVAYVVGDRVQLGSGRLRIGWTSPSAPAGHAFGVAPSYGYAVRWAGDGVAFQRYGPRGTKQVGIAPQSGAPARLLADGVVDGFDADATRVTFAHAECEHRMIEVRPIPALTFVAKRPTRCPLRLTRAPRVSADATTLRVSVDCRGFAFACAGTIRLTLHRQGDAQLVLARGELFHATATLRLRTVARRLLRTSARISARLTVNFGSAQSDPPVRSRTIRLHVSR